MTNYRELYKLLSKQQKILLHTQGLSVLIESGELGDDALDLALFHADKEREDAAKAKEREDAAKERKDAMAHAEKMAALEVEKLKAAPEVKVAELELKKRVREIGDAATASRTALTYTELHGAATHEEWDLHFDAVPRDCADYVAAPEADVQVESIDLLTAIGGSCNLNCHDTHKGGVKGLHKPDAVFTHKECKFYTVSAPAVAFLAEFKPRKVIENDKAHVFPSSESGQVLDKLNRLRKVRKWGSLYGVLSNGHHYQLFMLKDSGAFASSNMFTFHDIGPLKAVMTMAEQSIRQEFWFAEHLAKEAQFAGMSVRALLGAGAHCRAWEVGGDDNASSVAVVVAQGEGVDHLLRNYGVFSDLATKRVLNQYEGPLYEPLHCWRDPDSTKAVAAFAQVGETWSASLYRAQQLTCQDVIDIADQIQFFHKCGYIHCDVALRNFVRYEATDGTFRSVLIDAGAAVKKTAAQKKWRGGTMNNASVEWLTKNRASVEAQLFDCVTVPTAVDELWSFAFAVMDLAFVRPFDSKQLIEFREEQMATFSSLGELVKKLDYGGVATAVAKLVCLPKASSAQPPSSSPEHLRTKLPLTPPPSVPSTPPATPLQPRQQQPSSPYTPAAPAAQQRHTTTTMSPYRNRLRQRGVNK